MRAAGGGERRFARVFAPLALFVLAFLVRCLPSQSVFLREGTLLFDPDAYYHMRRIVFGVANFPRTLGFDPYLNHPDGAQPIWPPLFDACVAALLLPFASGGDVAALEHLAVFVPPLLGAATVVALYCVARSHFGAAPAWLAGVILSLLSGHFWYSQLGFVDHHAAEAFVATLMLGAAMTLLARAATAGAEARALWRSTLATGAAFGAALLLWPGMLLHVGLVEAGLAVFALTRRDRAQAAAFAWRLAALHLVALALVAPQGLSARWIHWGPFSPVVLSAFQPWLMAAAGLGSAGCAVAWRFAATGGSPARRLSSALALAVALLGASAWAFPGLTEAAAEAWDWFAGDDPFQRSVGESLPLLSDGGGLSLRIAFARLSAFSLLVPLALCIFVVRAWRAPRAAPLLLFFGWTFGLAAAAVAQRRFFNAASVGVALLFGLALVEAQRALLRRFPQARIPVLAALAAAALALLQPTLATHSRDASNQWRALRGEKPRLAASTLERAVVVELADWIRENTPEPSDWLDANAKPAWGILAPWEIGHVLEYQARRPTVSDNFGNDIGSESYERALRYFRSDEASAAPLLDALAVRYVVVQRDTGFLGGEPAPGAMAIALFRRDGSLAGSAVAGHRGAAVERHRLVYESKPLHFTSHPNEPRYKVFELVRGALLSGESAPGAQVRATLGLRTNRGRPFVYSAMTQAGTDGRWALRVPYATHGGPESVRADPAYVLECGDEQQRLRVDEAAVREGARVEAPRPCAGAAAGLAPQPLRDPAGASALALARKG